MLYYINEIIYKLTSSPEAKLLLTIFPKLNGVARANVDGINEVLSILLLITTLRNTLKLLITLFNLFNTLILQN